MKFGDTKSSIENGSSFVACELFMHPPFDHVSQHGIEGAVVWDR